MNLRVTKLVLKDAATIHGVVMRCKNFAQIYSVAQIRKRISAVLRKKSFEWVKVVDGDSCVAVASIVENDSNVYRVRVRMLDTTVCEYQIHKCIENYVEKQHPAKPPVAVQFVVFGGVGGWF